MRLVRALPVLLLLAAPLHLAPAQGPSCSVDFSKPKEVGQAAEAVDQARALGGNPALAQRSLKEAMRALQDPKKVAGNPVAVSLLRAQVYLLWLQQPGVGETVTNEQLNAAGDRSAIVNLIASFDAELRSVETGRPECRDEIASLRNSKAWVDRIQKAFGALEAGQADSAAYWVSRSVQLNPRSPWTMRAQAELADRQGRPLELIALLQGAISEAATDTSLAAMAQDMRVRLAVAADEQSGAQQGAMRDSLRALAVATFTRLLADNPTGNLGNFAFNRASQLLQLAQDSVGVRSILARLVATPGTYGEDVLLQAANVARIAQRRADAIALYEGVRGRNPYNRDAAYILALFYYEAKDPAAMAPLVERSLEIDPINAEIAQLRSLLLGLQADAEKDAAKKKELRAKQSAATESALRMETTQRVAITQMEQKSTGLTMTGTLENLSDAPRSYVLGIDFIDATGGTLDSASVQIPTVAPTQQGTFSVTSTKAGVIGYRFRPMPLPPAMAVPKEAPKATPSAPAPRKRPG